LQLQNCTTATYDVAEVVAAAEQQQQQRDEDEDDDDAKQLQRRFP